MPLPYKGPVRVDARGFGVAGSGRVRAGVEIAAGDRQRDRRHAT